MRNVFPNRKGVFLFHGGEFYRICNGPEGPDKNQKQDAVRLDEAAACVFRIGGACGSAAFLFEQRQHGYDLGGAVHSGYEYAEKIDGVWEQRLRIHYNCVGEITIPKMLPLPIPDVTVNTRKGVFVNYAPAEIAG